MVLPGRIVAQQKRWTVIHGHEHVHGTIVVKVADGKTPAGYGAREQRATLVGNVVKSVAVVTKQEQRFAITHKLGVNFVNEIVGMPIGNHQVEIAIIVVIEKFHAP